MRSMVEGALRAPEKTFRRARQLRQQMSLPEVVLWQALRKARFAGLRIRRQHPIGPYILDFYCPAARLAIEVDGLRTTMQWRQPTTPDATQGLPRVVAR